MFSVGFYNLLETKYNRFGFFYKVNLLLFFLYFTLEPLTVCVTTANNTQISFWLGLSFFPFIIVYAPPYSLLHRPTTTNKNSKSAYSQQKHKREDSNKTEKKNNNHTIIQPLHTTIGDNNRIHH